MSIDKLQSKIRKLKNPVVVDLFMLREHIPPMYIEDTDFLSGYKRYVTDLLENLKTVVPAVRFSQAALSVYGISGIKVLTELLSLARKCGYYIFLDIPESLSLQGAKHIAANMFCENVPWQFDGLVLSSYIGSDGLSPFVPYLDDSDKDLFVVARTSNRSAAEMQDLLTGSRLAHMAMADVVYRFAPQRKGRCGYSRMALVAAASSADSLRTLRSKYKDLFLLLDGSDYPNANAKNCSFAFDQLGHGAIACVGLSVTAAWQESTENAIDAAQNAVERMKKNISRYTDIL